MDHFKPHKYSRFEGWYTRFHLPRGASLVAVLCTVPKAKDAERRVSLNLTYIPTYDETAKGEKVKQSELWSQNLDWESEKGSDGFELYAIFNGIKGSKEGDEMPNVRITITTTSASFHIRTPLINVLASAHNHTPWSTSSSATSDKAIRKSSPEGPFINLPLPLHWHVLSTFSSGQVHYLSIKTNSTSAPIVEVKDRDCTLHLEKNWANSFPPSHMWVQAISPTPKHISIPRGTTNAAHDQQQSKLHKSLTLAGGQILGLEAYLVGYRNNSLTPPLQMDMRPPFTLILPFPSFFPKPIKAPFISVHRDWKNRSLKMTIRDLKHRLEISASASEEGFFPFSSPQKNGFRSRWMAESLQAKVEVKVFRKRKKGWFSWEWECVTVDVFEGGGLEFGGEYFLERGEGGDGECWKGVEFLG